MNNLRQRRKTIAFIVLLLLIFGGLYLLADSPVGDAFMRGFEDGYNKGMQDAQAFSNTEVVPLAVLG